METNIQGKDALKVVAMDITVNVANENGRSDVLKRHEKDIRSSRSRSTESKVFAMEEEFTLEARGLCADSSLAGRGSI